MTPRLIAGVRRVTRAKAALDHWRALDRAIGLRPADRRDMLIEERDAEPGRPAEHGELDRAIALEPSMAAAHNVRAAALIDLLRADEHSTVPTARSRYSRYVQAMSTGRARAGSAKVSGRLHLQAPTRRRATTACRGPMSIGALALQA